MNEEKGLLKRLVAELNRDVANLKASVESVSIEAIEMAGIVQSSFADFSSLLSSSRETFQRHSAFYIYHTDATFFSIRALREALCSYYGAAGSILRNAYEAIVRGTFWECLARERYRDHAEVVGEKKQKIEGIRRNILDWFDDVFQAKPQLETALEKQSAAIFDIISPLFKDRGLHRVVPSLSMMIRQLSTWKMFEPVTEPVSEIYDDLYWSLSEDTHVVPDMTMIGRLIMAGKDASTIIEPSPEEFDRFLGLLCRVTEIEALTVLNVLEDDVRTDEALRAKIASMRPMAEEINLPRVVQRIQTLAM